MSNIKIQKAQLNGQVRLSGAKNSALKLLTASVLTDEAVEILNSPNGLLDMQVHIKMLNQMGKTCIEGDRYLKITENNILSSELLWDERSIRNSLLILGSLTTRFGNGKVPLPGGCPLGDRKYDLHIMLLEKFGAKIWEEEGYLCTKTEGRLKGCDIHLPIRSTGATENAILCASLALGTTTIWNPHIRPEIIDLITMLNKMGANIKVYGQKCIMIEGVEALGGVRHQVISDNMEALTWAIGAVVTQGDVEIIDFPFEHLEVPLVHLRESGMKFYRGENSLIVRGGEAFPIDISTGPYPGINSDMQPLFAVFGATSKGESRIIDLRFPGRYDYVKELAKMGVNYEIDGSLLKIHGGRKLKGAKVVATDLRAGIALLLAGMTADGVTEIEDAWQIARGYENLKSKLKGLGVTI
ncbi:UDP-N-acetylglucosamine 1-carboxyvinyltransferase [Winogradskyella sp.]|uniref:UDP-N-acetylglucosamine 1-carboxyvinyltransferase n=1 Tax=Winogradskyella sp. TaxID=1883156 RepID=UPI003AB66E82